VPYVVIRHSTGAASRLGLRARLPPPAPFAIKHLPAVRAQQGRAGTAKLSPEYPRSNQGTQKLVPVPSRSSLRGTRPGRCIVATPSTVRPTCARASRG
jgi:hypothetical protein